MYINFKATLLGDSRKIPLCVCVCVCACARTCLYTWQLFAGRLCFVNQMGIARLEDNQIGFDTIFCTSVYK